MLSTVKVVSPSQIIIVFRLEYASSNSTYVISDFELSEKKAVHYCTLKGGRLLRVESEEESKYVTSLMSNNMAYFVG